MERVLLMVGLTVTPGMYAMGKILEALVVEIEVATELRLELLIYTPLAPLAPLALLTLALLAAFARSTTVSYTHLDVYKRQV